MNKQAPSPRCTRLAGLALASLALLPLAAGPALAQAEAPLRPLDQQGIGVYISNIAGSGVTYQRVFANGWGFHVSGVGYGDGRGQNFLNVGAAGTREFARSSWGSLYGLVAIGYGLTSYAGGGGVAAAASVQSNLAPGLGVTWGPLFAELGYSFFPGSSTLGFTPAGGLGAMWRF